MKGRWRKNGKEEWNGMERKKRRKGRQEGEMWRFQGDGHGVVWRTQKEGKGRTKVGHTLSVQNSKCMERLVSLRVTVSKYHHTYQTDISTSVAMSTSLCQDGRLC